MSHPRPVLTGYRKRYSRSNMCLMFYLIAFSVRRADWRARYFTVNINSYVYWHHTYRYIPTHLQSRHIHLMIKRRSKANANAPEPSSSLSSWMPLLSYQHHSCRVRVMRVCFCQCQSYRGHRAPSCVLLGRGMGGFIKKSNDGKGKAAKLRKG